MEFMEKFKKDIEHFKMTIECDDTGVNRTLLFKAPLWGDHSFRIITWFNGMCICGDVGSYVFRCYTDPVKYIENIIKTCKPEHYADTLSSIVYAEDSKSFGVKTFSEDLYIEKLSDLIKEGHLYETEIEDLEGTLPDNEYEACDLLNQYSSEGDWFNYEDLKDYTTSFGELLNI